MAKNLIILLIIAIVILAGIFVYRSLPQEEAEELSAGPSGTEGASTAEITPPEATGDIDNLVDALLQELTDEEATIKQGEADVDLAAGDTAEIDGFGSVAAESELGE